MPFPLSRAVFMMALFCLGTLTLAAQNPPYGNCPAPAKAGVNICQPFTSQNQTTIASPFQLIATGTGGGAAVRVMEVWADGRKITETPGNLFDAPIALSIGSHQVTVVELDYTGAFVKSNPINVNIDYNSASTPCPAPGSPGVNNCVPGQSSCHTSAYTIFVATGTGASGSVQRMELWANGTKLANFPGNHIDTSLYLVDYTQVTLIEVDSKGAYIKSPPFTLLSC